MIGAGACGNVMNARVRVEMNETSRALDYATARARLRERERERERKSKPVNAKVFSLGATQRLLAVPCCVRDSRETDSLFLLRHCTQLLSYTRIPPLAAFLRPRGDLSPARARNDASVKFTAWRLKRDNLVARARGSAARGEGEKNARCDC